jgi:hypothetical protein
MAEYQMGGTEVWDETAPRATGYCVQVVSLAVGWGYFDHSGKISGNSPWDGQYIRDFGNGVGTVGTGWLLTSSKSLAKVYPDQASALAAMNTVDPNNPWRWDGKPNCPITQLNLSIVPYP